MGSSAVEDRGPSMSSETCRCECRGYCGKVGEMDAVASETAIANGNGVGARRTAAALAVADLGPEGAPRERIVCPVLKMGKHFPSEALAVAKMAESVKRAQEATPATASAKFAAAISLNSEGPMVSAPSDRDGGRDANQMDVDDADGSGDLGQRAGRYPSKGGVMRAASRERLAAVETRPDTEENMRGKAGERGSAAAPSSVTAGPSLMPSTPSSVNTSMAGSVGGQSQASIESGREESAGRAPLAAAPAAPSGGSYAPTTVTLSAKVAFVGGIARRNIRTGGDPAYNPKEDEPFTVRVSMCFLYYL